MDGLVLRGQVEGRLRLAEHDFRLLHVAHEQAAHARGLGAQAVGIGNRFGPGGFLAQEAFDHGNDGAALLAHVVGRFAAEQGGERGLGFAPRGIQGHGPGVKRLQGLEIAGAELLGQFLDLARGGGNSLAQLVHRSAGPRGPERPHARHAKRHFRRALDLMELAGRDRLVSHLFRAEHFQVQRLLGHDGTVIRAASVSGLIPRRRRE